MIKFKDLCVHLRGDKKKKCILFLHGAGADSEMWNNHIEVLKANFYCIVPDLPGHGKSNHIKWTSIEHVGDELAKLIKSIANEKIMIVGFSLGGSLTYYLLEKYPDLFERALIDGASAYPIKANIIPIQMMSPFLKTDLVLNAMAKSLSIPKADYDSFKRSFKVADKESFKRSMIQANKFKLWDKRFTQQVPVLYASGSKESKIMHQSHVELSRLNEKSICVQYPGKGHAWMMFDMETHVAMVRKWLTSQDPFSVNKLSKLQ